MNPKKVYNDVCHNLLYCYYSSLSQITESLAVFCMVTELEWFIALLRYQNVFVHGNSEILNVYVLKKKKKNGIISDSYVHMSRVA